MQRLTSDLYMILTQLGEKQRIESASLLICPCTAELPIWLILFTKLNSLHTELTSSSIEQGMKSVLGVVLAGNWVRFTYKFSALEGNSPGCKVFNSTTQNYVPLCLL